MDWRNRIDPEVFGRALSNVSGMKFAHPWRELDEDRELWELDEEGLLLAGYGSLMNPESARRTFPDTPEHGHQPALCYGAKRIFNYRMPPEALKLYGEENWETETVAVAALNTIWTGDVEDVFNARMIPLQKSDLHALREREKGYDLMPVIWTPWDGRADEPRIGMALSAPENLDTTSRNLSPCCSYSKVCREGAKLAGVEFEQCFADTTYLADGVTRFCQNEVVDP